jgi:hypothetical protein
MYRSWLAFLVVLGGCEFHVNPAGNPLNAEPDQSVTVDLAGAAPDLAAPAIDLLGLDLTGVDLATPPPPDLSPVFTPSHVPAGSYKPAASDLTDVTEIDTKSLKIRVNGGAAQDVPAGVTFVNEGANLAVLSVGAWTVNQELRVVGDRGLVVVAAKAVTVAAPLHADAQREVPGPGGSAASAGSGQGADGEKVGTYGDTGGSGAGFGTDGAQGGDVTGVNGMNGKSGGSSYGDPIATFSAGSGGGNGGEANKCPKPGSLGGGGGGSLQISSAISLTLAASGNITASGGGGRGGCVDGPAIFASGGGGGGSGGEIFLEAPTIAVNGILAANGGAGGGGATYTGTVAGFDGNDGQASGMPAQPTGPAAPTMMPGNHGGAGGAINALPQKGGSVGVDLNAGGGGGAVGRIWLRTRGVPATSAGNISPAALTDTSL